MLAQPFQHKIVLQCCELIFHRLLHFKIKKGLSVICTSEKRMFNRLPTKRLKLLILFGSLVKIIIVKKVLKRNAIKYSHMLSFINVFFCSDCFLKTRIDVTDGLQTIQTNEYIHKIYNFEVDAVNFLL